MMPENWLGGLLIKTRKAGILSLQCFCLITCNAYMSADISACFMGSPWFLHQTQKRLHNYNYG